VAEQLSEDYLEVTLSGHDTRTLNLVVHGLRWTDPGAGAQLDDLVHIT
jgi:hypothetical protein